LIDYETRSKVDLGLCGASKYARDKSTEVMCLCAVDIVRVSGELKADRSTKRVYDFRNAVTDDIKNYLPSSDEIMFAFNAGFEYLITTETLGIPFPIEKVYCLQHMALYNGLPASLDDISKCVPLKSPKDEVGHRLMLRMCKPDKFGKFPYSDEMQDRLVQYCEQDIEAEAEVIELLIPASEEEITSYHHTLRMNLAGVPVDMELTDKASEVLIEVTDELKAKFPDINLRSHAQVKAFTKSHGYTMESTDKEHVTNALADPACPERVKELLEVKDAGVGSSSVSKFEAVRNYTDSDGALRMAYRHHGAIRTGRWTSQGVQIQNLPRGEKYLVEPNKSGKWYLPDVREYIRNKDIDSLYLITNGRPMDALRSVIRTLFAPPKGHKFIDRDLAAIEARLVVWLSRSDNISIFSDFDKGIGAEPYMIFADMLGVDRFLGKTTVLSSGYGCGPNTFMQMMAQMGRKIDEAMARRCLQAYKDMFPEVVEMWKLVEGAAKLAIERPGSVTMVPTPTEPIKFTYNGNHLRLKLPSGRVLSYWNAKLQIGMYGPEISYMTYGSENSTAMGWHRTKTWGGSMVGHITQASAACILRHIVSELFKVGIEPTMLIHDEVVVTAKESEAQQVYDKMGTIMKAPPAWALGLPMQSSGWIGDFFTKD